MRHALAMAALVALTGSGQAQGRELVFSTYFGGSGGEGSVTVGACR